MKLRPVILASLILPAAASGEILVNLDATALPAGPLVTWMNTGTLGGAFTRETTTPNVTTVAGSNTVTLNGTSDWYVGPATPLGVTGNGLRSIEVWAYNPALADEETMVAWGRRGSPDGTNMSFNYGNNGTWGAVGHWGAPDMAWNGNPPAGAWHYLVYTYDGGVARVYQDGILKNSRSVGLNTWAVNNAGGTLPFVIGTQNEANGTHVAGTYAGSMSIARVRIHNTVMSPTEVANNYTTEGATFGKLPGVAAFTATPSVYLPGQSVTIAWNTTLATTVTIDQGIGTVAASGSLVVNPATTTTYTITAANGTGSSNAQVIVAPFQATQLTHRYNFNEASGSTAVADSVGSAHAVVLGTGATRDGTKVTLPGGASATAPYIDFPNGLLSANNEITIEGWMTLNGSQNWSRLFDFGTGTAGEIFAPGGAANGTEYLLVSAQVGGNTAQKRLSMRDDNVEQLFDLADPLTIGQQFHFAVVYSATANGGQPLVSYYKDGVFVGSLATTYRLQNIVDNNNWLGRSNFTGDNNTQGSYNEFRIWNGVLSPQSIADSTAAGPDALPTAPRVDAFASLTPGSIYRGESVKLSYVFSAPSGTPSGSINNGVGALPSGSGFVTVSPTATTTYTLTVTGPGGSRTANVTVTVLPSEPVVQNLAISTPYQTAGPVTLIASDPNTPVANLTYTITDQPDHGALSGTAPNLTYTPVAGYTGPDSFIYKANDGLSDSNIGTVTITVNPPPVAPTNVLASESFIESDLVSGGFLARLQAVDANPGETHTFALVPGTGSTHNGFFTLSGNQLISTHNFSGDLGQNISVRVRVTDNTNRIFERVLTFPVQAPQPHVKINEIHYNPARNTLLSEFIELYNPTGAPVNLSGWRFDNGVSYTFPAGTTMAPGAYLVIAKDPATIQKLYGVTALGPWTGGLDSQGEEIVLRDLFGDKVDGVDYGITAPWPTKPNGDGPTLELVHPTLDNDQGGNWRASNLAPTTVSYVTASSASWRYRKGTSEASAPVGAWRFEGFAEDATWLTGTAPIGVFKQNSDTSLTNLPETAVNLGTTLPDMATYTGAYTVNYRSVFFRKTFTASSSIPKQLLLRVMHNDAAIVWINGVEVARFGFPADAPSDPAFNTAAYYERGNDPWSEIVIPNADLVVHSGTNVLAVQGFAKPPQTRSTQEDFAAYNIFDFCVDAELKNVPDTLGTPGAQNSVFSAVNPPAVRDIGHSPKQPVALNPITVKARISDPQGVGTVTLSYQICTAGNFIPSTLPLSVGALQTNPSQPLPPNPAFENSANWTNVPMVDDGSIYGDIAGDGEFTGTIPGQPNRTLVRYRITANDLTGQNVRIPATDDPRLNFACFVYNGVPAYGSFSPATLNTLPVYQWITRPADFSSLLAYSAGEQFPNTNALNVLLARRYENWEGALIVGDQVIDHAMVRLRGGNSRYNGAGKRHFRFNFPQGTPLAAADEAGNEYPRKWEEMLFSKMFGNKGYYDWGLSYEVGGKMWDLVGVPIPQSHWVHFRVVQNADENHVSQGDFWGLYQALELPEGKNFLAARNLESGNFYKTSDWMQNGEMSERYQAAGSVDFAEDYDNIRYNIHQGTSQANMEKFINMPSYYRYNAVQEAVRHYDLFVEPTGRHRVKNLIWWFEPQAGNPLGRCLFMPYDWDASFGPNWNAGQEMVQNALFNYFPIPDSPTWTGTILDRTGMRTERRNAIRDLRDLLVYRDGTGRGPLDDILDDAYAKIAQFWPADRARWPSTGAQGDNPGGAPYKVQDMKNFMFATWTDPFGADPDIGAGGRAAYLDSISDALDAGQLPATPTITYSGAANYPVDGIALTSSAFNDPQGAGTFGAMQWRIGEITDPAAPAYDATAARIYEITDVWTSGELTSFNASITVPATALRVGHAYRARVRHKDNTGRYGHWSQPLTFTTTTSNYLQVLKDNLMITEVMYHPLPPNVTEAAAGWLEEDFEFIELTNISGALTLDLSSVRFTKGIDFDFSAGTITSLAPGARVLVVRNSAAFTARYGAGRPITAQWEAGDVLSNAGEEVKLSFGAGDSIHEFIYDDATPWPTLADAGGYSLVLINPTSRPDHALPASWRASTTIGGTPGETSTNFNDWAAAYGVSGPLTDSDGDAIVNQLEYALGGNPTLSSQVPLPDAAIQNLVVGGTPGNYLTLTFRRHLGAEDLSYLVEFSTDLANWSADGVLVGSTPNGDSTATETWRANSPITSGAKRFARLKVIRP